MATAEVLEGLTEGGRHIEILQAMAEQMNADKLAERDTLLEGAAVAGAAAEYNSRQDIEDGSSHSFPKQICNYDQWKKRWGELVRDPEPEQLIPNLLLPPAIRRATRHQ